MKLKYKIWDKEKKCWYKPIHEAYKGHVEELLLTPSGDLMMHTIENGIEKMIHESCFEDRFEVVWHTCYKDKKGEELCSGDILENENGIRMLIMFGEYEAFCPADQAFMKNVGFYVKAKGYPDMPLGPTEKYSKKIGNIYENPELLPK